MRRDLIQQAMAGDHDAYSELARGVIGRLYGAAMLILRDEARAQDATQEALVAAWRDLSALRDPDRFDAWIHRLLVRACYREARRSRRRWTVEMEVRPSRTVEPDVSPASAGMLNAWRPGLPSASRASSVVRRTRSCRVSGSISRSINDSPSKASLA